VTLDSDLERRGQAERSWSFFGVRFGMLGPLLRAPARLGRVGGLGAAARDVGRFGRFGRARVVQGSARSFLRPFSSSSEEEWVMNVPPLGDSITKGEMVEWRKGPGDYVFEDEEFAVMETDKVTFPLSAEKPGEIVEIYAEEETEIKVGEPLVKFKKSDPPAGNSPTSHEKEEQKAAPVAEPKPAEPEAESERKQESSKTPVSTPSESEEPKPSPPPSPESSSSSKAKSEAMPPPPLGAGERVEHRVKMSTMRRKISERLVEAQATAALLTTFNEIDMSHLMKMRAKHKDQFEKMHGVKLGFMSAFVAAATVALRAIPAANAVIDGKEIVHRDYVDISIAVSSPRGLVVPVLRNCQSMKFHDIERQIGEFGRKAREDQLTMEEMAGGTFTITNGGVFGSLFSTPMLNMPQSAILGMHAIKERPVTVDGEIVSRPMMFVALTYDHRLIDGRESVTFLKSIKEKVEDPERLLLGL